MEEVWFLGGTARGPAVAAQLLEKALQELANAAEYQRSCLGNALLQLRASLASSYHALGKHEEATAIQEAVLQLRRRILPPVDLDIALAMSDLAGSYSALGRHKDAAAMHKEVLQFMQRILPPEHSYIPKAMGNVADSFCKLGRHEEAMAMQEEFLQLRKRILPLSTRTLPRPWVTWPRRGMRWAGTRRRWPWTRTCCSLGGVSCPPTTRP
mmetsp:Transcript_14211/g.55944  ORF Transcript_14211/g.55944 Transcript_14211/m.55944 type:complete len:211 (-) Transcript_14211:107-739(-)